MQVTLHGGEAQCPICDLVFKSDKQCELHKRYREEGAKRGREFDRARCVHPSTIGMVAKINARGVETWVKPVEEDAQWWPTTQVERKLTQELTCISCGIVWERPAQRGRPPKQCAKCKEASVE